MKKKSINFNPFFYKIINFNKKINFIISNYNFIRIANSFSFEDILLNYLLLSKKYFLNIFLLYTGRLFLKTLKLVNKLKIRYNFNYKIYYPNLFLLNKYIYKYYLNGFYNNIILRKLCCYLRKIEPYNIILKRSKILISGQRKEHSFTRTIITEYLYDKSKNIIKCNLILSWTFKDIFYFMEKFNILNNNIYNFGYTSIGCNPCTRILQDKENIRDGRWWWESNNSKKECGINL